MLVWVVAVDAARLREPEDSFWYFTERFMSAVYARNNTLTGFLHLSALRALTRGCCETVNKECVN